MESKIGFLQKNLIFVKDDSLVKFMRTLCDFFIFDTEVKHGFKQAENRAINNLATIKSAVAV